VSAAPASQLALNMRLRDDATFASFHATAAHEPLLVALRGQGLAAGEPAIYLFGPRGSGKSHLLQAACHLNPDNSSYLPLDDLQAAPAAELLSGLERQGLVCIDDLDLVAGNPAWEEALFHFFNRARECGCRLLFAGRSSPRQLAVTLDDLRSRLGWGPVFQLPAPDDEQLQAVLQFRARCRGLDMPPEVGRFLVSRAPREMAALMRLLDTLDARSLADQRALTVPFVKQVLGL
jgi:DnaA family protein